VLTNAAPFEYESGKVVEKKVIDIRLFSSFRFYSVKQTSS